MKAGVNAKMIEAFDINDLANDVYAHNFGHRPFQVTPFVVFYVQLNLTFVVKMLKASICLDAYFWR